MRRWPRPPRLLPGGPAAGTTMNRKTKQHMLEAAKAATLLAAGYAISWLVLWAVRGPLG